MYACFSYSAIQECSRKSQLHGDSHSHVHDAAITMLAPEIRASCQLKCCNPACPGPIHLEGYPSVLHDLWRLNQDPKA